jgi:hypothetical protein
MTGGVVCSLVDKIVFSEIADAQRLAREWDAAHPREP